MEEPLVSQIEYRSACDKDRELWRSREKRYKQFNIRQEMFKVIQNE